MSKTPMTDKGECVMTSEEYLIIRGWKSPHYDDGPWTHPRRMIDDRERPFDLAEAVETQLAEDRALYNFVRDRSGMYGGMLTPREPQ